MSDGSRSFWSSIPGLVTGLAGLLTAIVGLFGLGVQQGWIGGSKGSGHSTETTTTFPGQVTTTLFGSPGGAGGSATTTGTGAFAVEPSTVEFKSVGAREMTVTVRNTGSVPLRVSVPTVTGTDSAQFRVTDVSCTKGSLDTGRSCDLTVSFSPSGPLRAYAATMVVMASGAPRSVEVKLTGSTLL